MVLKPAILDFDLDVGCGDVYVGRPYKIPYFFESTTHKMMKEPGGSDTITVKSWAGHFYQFYLTKFRGHSAMAIATTQKDYFVLPVGYHKGHISALGLEEARQRFLAENSVSHLRNYEKLVAHMENDGIFFSDEAVDRIYYELKRRSKL